MSTNKPLATSHPSVTVHHRTRRDTTQYLPGSLVSRLPAFVARIGVINNVGSLVTLAGEEEKEKDTSEVVVDIEKQFSSETKPNVKNEKTLSCICES